MCQKATVDTERDGIPSTAMMFACPLRLPPMIALASRTLVRRSSMPSARSTADNATSTDVVHKPAAVFPALDADAIASICCGFVVQLDVQHVVQQNDSKS